MAVAAKCCYENLDEKIDRLYALKDHFVEGVKKLPDTRVNGRIGRDSAPQIAVSVLQECAARCYCMRWKIRESMCLQALPAHLINLQ